MSVRRHTIHSIDSSAINKSELRFFITFSRAFSVFLLQKESQSILQKKKSLRSDSARVEHSLSLFMTSISVISLSIQSCRFDSSTNSLCRSLVCVCVLNAFAIGQVNREEKFRSIDFHLCARTAIHSTVVAAIFSGTYAGSAKEIAFDRSHALLTEAFHRQQQ